VVSLRLDTGEGLCAVLAWLQYRLLRFARDQRRETTLRLLVECPEEQGGVPPVVLSDQIVVATFMMATRRAG
jgi:hypothetical protein